MKRKKLSALLAVFAILGTNSGITAFSAEEAVSGNWHGLDWSLENHILTISGNQEIYCCTDTFPDDDMLAIPDWKEYSDEIYEIVIEEGVTGAEEHALAEYPNLKKITLPESFVFLAPWALADNPELTEISGLEHVKELNYRCLSNTGYIAENPFVIEDSILYYAEGTELTVPDGVTEIAPFAFGNLTGEDYINYSNSDTPENLCTYYEITLPETVQKIDDYAFALCATLTEVNIPDSVESIGDYAFYGCANLKDLTLSENVKSVGTKAFYNCRNLKNLTVENPETEFGTQAYGTVLNWDAKTAEKSGESAEMAEYYQKLTEKYPSAFDEAYANFILHFWNTNTYSRVKAELSEEENKTDTIQQGSITGHTGSTAQAFARKNQLAFASLDSISGISGDLNADSKLDIIDVIVINKVILGKEKLTAEQEISADINQDGKINAADSLAMLRRIVGIE